MASLPLTNGHVSPVAVDGTATAHASQPSDSELSDVKEAIAEAPLSDEDAPGEEYDEDEGMDVDSGSSEDVDAEGEPDGDYDSETPPPEQAAVDRVRSSSSQESRRPKRKASIEEDMEQNPELYGLRRSVRGMKSHSKYSLTVAQGRARLNRRIVWYPCPFQML